MDTSKHESVKAKMLNKHVGFIIKNGKQEKRHVDLATKSLHGSDTFTCFGENRGGEFCFPQGTYDKTQKTIKIHLEIPFQMSVQF